MKAQRRRRFHSFHAIGSINSVNSELDLTPFQIQLAAPATTVPALEFEDGRTIRVQACSKREGQLEREVGRPTASRRQSEAPAATCPETAPDNTEGRAT